MAYSVSATALSDVLLLTPKVHQDSRGFFFESFNHEDFARVTGADLSFVQDNHSCSSKGVLRGLHYQINRVQGKLVRVAHGEIFDVAVNLQQGHPEFGKWAGVTLSSKNQHQVWIPPGFAHGFLVLSDSADVLYKTTDYYSHEDERCIRWDDPDLAIDWPKVSTLTLSDKDLLASPLKLANTFKYDHQA